MSGLLTEAGRMTENPDTAVVLCDNVKGLANHPGPQPLRFRPAQAGHGYEQVMKYTCHVRLRDTSKKLSRFASARAWSNTGS